MYECALAGLTILHRMHFGKLAILFYRAEPRFQKIAAEIEQEGRLIDVVLRDFFTAECFLVGRLDGVLAEGIQH